MLPDLADHNTVFFTRFYFHDSAHTGWGICQLSLVPEVFSVQIDFS